MTKAAVHMIVMHGWCSSMEEREGTYSLEIDPSLLPPLSPDMLLRSKIRFQGNFYNPERIKIGDQSFMHSPAFSSPL